ncbi:MAG: HAMP domain-containing sensor histidine kinase [Candidatus Hydrothermales bacterium]
MKLFFFFLFVTGVTNFLIHFHEYLNTKRLLKIFLEREREKLREILSQEKFVSFPEIEMIVSYKSGFEVIYKKENVILSGEDLREISKIKDFYLDKNQKFWLNLKDEKVLVRYENLPLIYIITLNSNLRLFFNFLFTLTFFLLLYAFYIVISNFFVWLEEKDKKITDLFKDLFGKSVLKEMEEIESKRKFIEIAEISALFSHELKNSLQSILTYMKLVRNKIEDSIFDKIYEEVKSLNSTMEDYQRYIIKGEKVTLESVNIKEVVLEALEELSFDKEVEIIKNIEEANLRGNKILLKKMVSNILKNSQEAIEKKGKIKIEGFLRDNKYFLYIEDTGIGMDKKVLERATEPFFTTKARGLGLGLFFVKKIAEIHSAKLEIESKKGKGTKVKLEFPL